MTRVTRLKLLYVLVLAALGGAALSALAKFAPDHRWLGAVFLALVLLVPGRIQGHFHRDLFSGLRAQRAEQFATAHTLYQRFLAELARAPWKKRLIWLAWTVYTTDVAAMTYNNIAVAHLHAGEWQHAGRAARRALALDGLYPLPHLTLATLAAVDDDHDEIGRQLQLAESLGYAGTTVDQLIEQAQQLLATIEGRRPPGPTAQSSDDT